MIRRLGLLAAFFLPLTAAANDENIDYLLQDRVRLESIQMRVLAKRNLMDWVRQQSIKTADEKYDAERKRLRGAFDDLVKEMRGKSSERRADLIRELENFVLKYSDTQASGDLLLRLAELYFEESNYRFILEMDAYEREMQAFDDGKIANPPEFPDPDYRKALELYREFVQLYMPQCLNAKAKPHENPHRYSKDALYLYAFILEDMGDEDVAVQMYECLLKEDPRGPLAPEVAFRIGEYYFLTGDLEDAAKRYRVPLQLQDKTFLDKALYKLSWTYYRMGDFDRALLGFVEMVDYGAQSAEATAMRNESLQYIGIVFSERGGLPALLAFFDKLGGRPYLDEVIAKLGDIYFETADFRSALAVYEEILKRSPNSRQAPDVARQVAASYEKLENEAAVVDQYKFFSEKFGDGSEWQKRWNRGDDVVLARSVRDEAEQKAFAYATYWHANAQKTGAPALYARAISAYEAFERQYPTSVKLADAVFNQADIRYELKQWVAAGTLYARVPEIAVNPANEMFSESAWNMILAYRKALEVYEATDRGRQLIAKIEQRRKQLEAEAEVEEKRGSLSRAAGAAATASTPSATEAAVTGAVDTTASTSLAAKTRAEAQPAPTMPEAARDLLKASLYYVKLYPLGERSPAVYYNTGDIYMRYGMYERARGQYVSFVERFPDHEFLMDGIRQVTRTFFLERKFGELVAWGYAIYDSPLANRPEVREYFTTILSGAMFKDAQQLENEGKLEDAAKVYLDMVKRFPESEFVDKALINAGAAYQKQGNWAMSTEIFLRFYGMYPKHDFAPQALFQTAWNAERVLDFGAAVSRYTELLQVYPKAKDTKDALFNSASILAKLGDSRRAAELYLLYISKFPGEDDEADNLFFAGKAYYDDGDFATAETVFQRFVKHKNRNEREVEVLYMLASVARARNNVERFWKYQDEIIAAHNAYTANGKPVDPKYAGEAAFLKAERVNQGYRSITLRLPMEVMANLLERKAAALKTVVETYTGVVQFKDPLWSSAALHMIGDAYQHFAESLFQAPVPPELDEEEVEIYKMELEDQAFPIEDQAMKSWQRNLELAVRLGIYNEWVKNSRDKLVKLYPDTAQVKDQERWQEASNDFFYNFQASGKTVDDAKIDGHRVVYLDSPYRVENIDERYRIVSNWTQRQKYVIFDVSLAPPILLQAGQPIEIEGIKALWSKHFQ